MAERENSTSPWAAFIAGIFLVAIVAVGVFAFNGGFERQQTAELELSVPDVNVPEVDLPAPPPMPSLPPTAEAPAQ